MLFLNIYLPSYHSSLKYFIHCVFYNFLYNEKFPGRFWLVPYNRTVCLLALGAIRGLRMYKSDTGKPDNRYQFENIEGNLIRNHLLFLLCLDYEV